MTPRIQRLPDVLRLRGIGRSTLYADIQKGLWTRPVSTSARCAGWPENETDTLIRARISNKSTAEIRELVIKLEAARKSGEG